MGFVRVWILLLAVLAVVYLVLRVVLRLRERRRLAAEWQAAAGARAGLPGDREDFVRDGMALYDRSLRRRLLWGVIVVPMAGLGLLLYALNVA